MPALGERIPVIVQVGAMQEALETGPGLSRSPSVRLVIEDAAKVWRDVWLTAEQADRVGRRLRAAAEAAGYGE